jgi:hypothetical protein
LEDLTDVIENSIHQGNALEVMCQIPDESLDLVVCDGPYGVTTNKWDRVPCIQDFNLHLIQKFSKKLKEGGAIYLFGKLTALTSSITGHFLGCAAELSGITPADLLRGESITLITMTSFVTSSKALAQPHSTSTKFASRNSLS